MKTKHLLFALAAPMFVVACTNEELVENATIVQDLGDEISTEGFVLKSDFGLNSRMSFDGSVLNWVLDYNSTNTDKLGLCLNLDGQAQTNYEFTVNSLWSKAGNQYKVNGAAFNPSSVVTGDTDVTINGNIATAPLADFVTKNASIFKGTYIAYYPYNASFNEASSTIPVSVEVMQERGTASEDNVGKYSFYVSDPFEITGGQTEAKFTMRQVLPILRFDLKNLVSNTTQKVSKIEVSAEGGMPVSGGIDVNLVSAFTESNIKVDKTAEKQFLLCGGMSLAYDAETKAYMTVMPGSYTDLTVRVIMEDGKYFEKTIPSVTLKANSLQPITLNITELAQGSVYDQITTPAELKKAIATAASEPASKQIEINVIKPLKDSGMNLFGTKGTDFTTALGNPKIVIKGEKITVEAVGYADPACLKNVTFENEVEFTGTYTSNSELAKGGVTFKGKTTFKGNVTIEGIMNLEGATEFGGTVIVKDNAQLNVAAGTTVAKGNITVGSNNANIAKLNVAEKATLSTMGADLVINQNKEHEINIKGTLNLGNNAEGTTGSTISLNNNSQNVLLAGKINVSSKSSIDFTTNTGAYSVANGTITNEGTIKAESNINVPMGSNAINLVNKGTIEVDYADAKWFEHRFNITNEKEYKLINVAATNINAVVKNQNNAFPYVNSIETVDIADGTTIEITETDMSQYDLTLNYNPSGSDITSSITIPASKVWNVNKLTVNNKSTNDATSLTIKPAIVNTSVEFKTNSLSIIGNNVDSSKAKLIFDKNGIGIVTASIPSLIMTKSTLEIIEGNKVTYTIDKENSSNYTIK